MKTLALSIALALTFAGTASACILKISPSTFEAKVGETLNFNLERYLTHRSCTLPIEETKITVSRGTIVDPGTWKKGNPDKLDFKVRFDKEGDATVRVERSCPREGLITVEAKGKIIKDLSTAGTTKESKETLPQSSSRTLSMSQVIEPINLKLWYTFFAIGVIAFLLKLSSYRKPLLLLSLTFLGFYLGGCPEPVGTPFFFLSRNQAMFLPALILFAIPLGISLLWGRVFCGWICPLGGAQELIHKAQVPMRCYQGLPPYIDRPLKWLKFAILIGVGYLTWRSSTNIFSQYEPFKVLFNFTGTPLAIAILIITLVISLIISRPFCRYACPFGAILKIAGALSYFKIKLYKDSCSECGSCTREGVCPMGAIICEINSKRPKIDNSECIACLECTKTCKRSSIDLM
ncbi:MAG: 4Fe-4S binding protein [Synergistetes bacterium]|nr:4Fe-4S binding protein [Synergistota bacterium]MDW8192874.1 4Fe-4S binding protein [Synergistota bacterium]